LASLTSVILYPRTDRCFFTCSVVAYFGKFFIITLLVLKLASPLRLSGSKSSAVITETDQGLSDGVMDRFQEFKEIIENLTKESGEAPILRNRKLPKEAEAKKGEETIGADKVHNFCKSFLNECNLTVTNKSNSTSTSKSKN
jgi:hypothetical protein